MTVSGKKHRLSPALFPLPSPSSIFTDIRGYQQLRMCENKHTTDYSTTVWPATWQWTLTVYGIVILQLYPQNFFSSFWLCKYRDMWTQLNQPNQLWFQQLPWCLSLATRGDQNKFQTIFVATTPTFNLKIFIPTSQPGSTWQECHQLMIPVEGAESLLKQDLAWCALVSQDNLETRVPET